MVDRRLPHPDGDDVINCPRMEVESLPKELFDLTDERVDEAFLNYVNSKFPFVSRMKAIAERFGAMPRGKTFSSCLSVEKSLRQLLRAHRFMMKHCGKQ